MPAGSVWKSNLPPEIRIGKAKTGFSALARNSYGISWKRWRLRSICLIFPNKNLEAEFFATKKRPGIYYFTFCGHKTKDQKSINGEKYYPRLIAIPVARLKNQRIDHGPGLISSRLKSNQYVSPSKRNGKQPLALALKEAL